MCIIKVKNPVDHWKKIGERWARIPAENEHSGLKSGISNFLI